MVRLKKAMPQRTYARKSNQYATPADRTASTTPVTPKRTAQQDKGNDVDEIWDFHESSDEESIRRQLLLDQMRFEKGISKRRKNEDVSVVNPTKRRGTITAFGGANLTGMAETTKPTSSKGRGAKDEVSKNSIKTRAREKITPIVPTTRMTRSRTSTGSSTPATPNRNPLRNEMLPKGSVKKGFSLVDDAASLSVDIRTTVNHDSPQRPASSSTSKFSTPHRSPLSNSQVLPTPSTPRISIQSSQSLATPPSEARRARSAGLTPKQEQVWKFMDRMNVTPQTVKRRRLIDTLREEAEKREVERNESGQGVTVDWQFNSQSDLDEGQEDRNEFWIQRLDSGINLVEGDRSSTPVPVSLSKQSSSTEDVSLPMTNRTPREKSLLPRTFPQTQPQGNMTNTYSQRRTFLADDSMRKAPRSMTQTMVEDDSKQGIDNFDLNLILSQPLLQRSPSLHSEDMDEWGELDRVKSLHELKSQGEDKRFRQEIEDLLDSLSAEEGIKLRRSSALEICENILKDIVEGKDKGIWRRKFRGVGGLHRVVAELRDAASDPVLLFAVNLVISVFANPPDSDSLGLGIFILPSGPSESDPLSLLLQGILDETDLISFTRDKSLGLNKLTDSTIRGLHSLCLKALATESINSKQWAVRALKGVQAPNESGGIIQQCVGFLGGYENDIGVIGSVIGLLERATQGRLVSIHVDEAGILETLGRRLMQKWDVGDMDDEGRDSTLSLLRLLINVTNTNTEACDLLISPASDVAQSSLLSLLLHKIISSKRLFRHEEDEKDQESKEFEYLLLCLGLLINIAEGGGRVKELVIKNGEEGLKEVFKGLVGNGQSQANVALGYLSLLLAHLMLPFVSPISSAQMSGLAVESWIKQEVIRILEEFVVFNRLVETQDRLQPHPSIEETGGMAAEVEKVLGRLKDLDK